MSDTKTAFTCCNCAQSIVWLDVERWTHVGGDACATGGTFGAPARYRPCGATNHHPLGRAVCSIPAELCDGLHGAIFLKTSRGEDSVVRPPLRWTDEVRTPEAER